MYNYKNYDTIEMQSTAALQKMFKRKETCENNNITVLLSNFKHHNFSSHPNLAIELDGRVRILGLCQSF